jgi:transposase
MSRKSARTKEQPVVEPTAVTDGAHGGDQPPTVEHEGTGVRGAPNAPESPNPEVPEQAKRRRFSAKYKLNILHKADSCIEKGQLGALLRREGLYSSHLMTWRRQREEGSLQGLAPKKRGRKANPNRKSKRETQLEGEVRRLRRQLEQAETIIEIQKKVASLLGIPLKSSDSGDNT